jgi:hypothetical protein
LITKDFTQIFKDAKKEFDTMEIDLTDKEVLTEPQKIIFTNE